MPAEEAPVSVSVEDDSSMQFMTEVPVAGKKTQLSSGYFCPLTRNNKFEHFLEDLLELDLEHG